MKDLFVDLISHLGVGDGDFAFDGLQFRLFFLAACLFQFLGKSLIHSRVYAADEEAGNRSDAAYGFAFGGATLKPFDIGIDGLIVSFKGKQQRDVDVDALINALFNRRYAFGSAGDFDHHVFAVNLFPQTLSFFDGRLCVVGQQGRAFQTDIAVQFIGAFINRREDVCGCLNILYGQSFVNFKSRLFLFRQLLHLLKVIIRTADGFFKNRRIGCHATQRVFINQALQFA